MYNFYDFIVIGAGISACTFASSLNRRLSNASILLVEQGRRVGGRSTTRKSLKNLNLEFDHGLSSIFLSTPVSPDLLRFINPLINSNKLIDISNQILTINEFGDFNDLDVNDKSYRGFPFMIDFCKEIINQSVNKKKIDFLFNTFTKSIRRKNDLWEIKIDNGSYIKSQYLILSSSLIAHPRCLEIFNLNSIPLRDAFEKGKDLIVDSVLATTSKQEYIKRKNFILYVSNSTIVDNFSYRYLQIVFSKVIKKDLNFEKIVFQRQIDGTMVIVLNCLYLSKLIDITFDKILQALIKIFLKYQSFVDLFSQAKLIDTMDWRASQPFNNFISKEFQLSLISNIGFCGDWFEFEGCSSVEAAMNSSIRLAKLLT